MEHAEGLDCDWRFGGPAKKRLNDGTWRWRAGASVRQARAALKELGRTDLTDKRYEQILAAQANETKALARWEAKQQWHPCDSPNLMVCAEHGCVLYVPCKGAADTGCAPCEDRRRKQIRTVARLPLLVAPPGSVVLLTLTAPGSQRHCMEHHWNNNGKRDYANYKCRQRYDRGTKEWKWIDPECIDCPCSERRMESDEAVAHWNGLLGRRWNDFITEIRRSIPVFAQIQYFKALEAQERGALHVHALIRFPHKVVMSPEQHASFREIALHHGFGHSIDFQIVGEGRLSPVVVARYVAKYVTKATGNALMPSRKECECFPWEDCTDRCPTPFQPKKKTYRRWTTSRGWGCSLREVLILIGLTTHYVVN